MRCSSIWTRAGRTGSLKRFSPMLRVSTVLTSRIQVLWSVALDRTVIYSRRFEGRHFLHVHRRIFVFNWVMFVVWIGWILQNRLPVSIFKRLRKFAKAIISFVMSVCPSLRPHGTTRLILNGFSWNFIFERFSKICGQNSNFIKIWQS